MGTSEEKGKEEKKEFVGRKSELEDFDKFLKGERPNWDGRGKGAPLLLVRGDEGMGKSALLRAMAERAYNQNHYVIPRKVDERKPDFREQIYPIIAMLNAMVKKKKPLPLRLLEEIDWFNVALAVLGTVAPGVKDLVNFLQDIRKKHQDFGGEDGSLVWLFRSALLELDSKIEDDQRIIILIDPEKKSPKALIPLLREISSPEMPRKVRFVIAQRPEDAVIKNVVEERELRELCAEHMDLGKMNENESLKFIKDYATDCELNEATREVFLERYGGWPLLMELGLDELQEVEGEITEEIIKDLPSDIKDFWDKRYKKVKEKDSRAFLQTVNLLPHPYLLDDVAGFAKLEPDAMELASSSDCPVWQLLREEDYDEIYSGEIWEDCPTHKHATAKEYVVDLLKTKKNKKLYDKRLDAIVSHYKEKIGADLKDKDALVYILPHMIDGQLWDEVEKLLTNIEYLKKMQSPEEQYIFQKDVIDLLKNQEISTDKLGEILKEVLKAIKNQMEDSMEKLDWLDIFAYWIINFGSNGELGRISQLNKLSRKFDEECGRISMKLANKCEKNLEYGWALRFAGLATWVYQRSNHYKECIDACRRTEDLCEYAAEDKIYYHLLKAGYIRTRARALARLASEQEKERTRQKYEEDARMAYEDLKAEFSLDGQNTWILSVDEWKILEDHESETLLPTRSTVGIEKGGSFKAQVVSNTYDAISAMFVIQFLKDKGGEVKWIHSTKFKNENFAPENTKFTILIGGPKAPGISEVADRFYEADKDAFLRLYSAKEYVSTVIEVQKGNTFCYMVGGPSGDNTLEGAVHKLTEKLDKRIGEAQN